MSDENQMLLHSLGSPRSIMLLGCFFLGVGIWLATWSILELRECGPSSQWWRAEGIVEHTFLAPSLDKDLRFGLIQWCPRVRYCYWIDGCRYESAIVSLRDPATADGWTISVSDWESACLSFREELLQAKYPVGSSVAVYYNPEDPSQACLERFSFFLFAFLCPGSFFCLWKGIRYLGRGWVARGGKTLSA